MQEKEHLTRRYTVEIILMIGPDLDIPAPDLGTDEQTMAVDDGHLLDDPGPRACPAWSPASH